MEHRMLSLLNPTLAGCTRCGEPAVARLSGRLYTLTNTNYCKEHLQQWLFVIQAARIFPVEDERTVPLETAAQTVT